MAKKTLGLCLLAVAVSTFLAAPLMAATSLEEATRRIIPDRTFQLEDEEYTSAADGSGNYAPVQSYTAGSYFDYEGDLLLDVPGPGVQMGATSYDYQKNGAMNHQVAADASTGFVHFSWTAWPTVPDSIEDVQRFVSYQLWDPTLNAGAGGFKCGPQGQNLGELDSRAGYTTIDILDDDGVSQVAFHEFETAGARPYQPKVARALLAGNCSHGKDGLTNDAGHEWLWPRVAAGDADDGGGGGEDSVGVEAFIHVVSSDGSVTGPSDFGYHRGRRVGGITTWSLPAVMAMGTTLSQTICEDRNSHNVAFVWAKRRDNQSSSQRNQDVAYLESPNDGYDWVNGNNTDANDDPGGNEINITNYADDAAYRAYIDLAALYDHQGDLHIVWNGEYTSDGGQGLFLNQCDLLHWASATGIDKIGIFNYEPEGINGGWQLNASKMAIGIGYPGGTLACDADDIDGYLYVTYTQFAGQTAAEQADVAANGYQNAELYLSISNDDGNSWAPGLNLTNTQTPGCDPINPIVLENDTCGSEHWSSIAEVVNDTAHIQYIADVDAGGIPQSEGAWTLNPVKYLRLDGSILCPLVVPNAAVKIDSDPLCEYNAPTNTTNLESLTLENIGNASMTYSIVVTEDNGPTGWLSVSGAQSGSLPASSGEDIRVVTMGPIAAEGLYTGNITVNHNDASKPAFSFDIAFFVFDTFICPEDVTLYTAGDAGAKAATSKSVGLEVSNVESFGRENSFGGMWRQDSIFYTTGTGGTDTVTNFNPLFDGSLAIAAGISGNDTLVFRDIFSNATPSNPGFRGQSSLVVDSSGYTSGADVTASAVQSTVDSLIGVDVKYVFPQHDDSADFVIVKWKVYNRTASPITGLKVGTAIDFDVQSQTGSENIGEHNSGWNFVYAIGSDTDASGESATPNQFSAGVSAVQCTPAAGRTNDNPTNVYPLSGFSDGYIDTQLGLTGFAKFTDSITDIHAILTMDQALNLNTADDYGYYCVALVSSIVSEADLLQSTAEAWKYCFGWQLVETAITVDLLETITSPFLASGSHEGGLGGGCCGCVITSPDLPITGFTLTSAGCSGDLTVKGADVTGGATPGTYNVTLRVQDLCAQYTDDCILVVTVKSACDCSNQGDVAPIITDGDGGVDVLDGVALIDEVFRSGPETMKDPSCPNTRGDIAPLITCGDGGKDVLDVVAAIDWVFRSGPSATDPCVDCP